LRRGQDDHDCLFAPKRHFSTLDSDKLGDLVGEGLDIALHVGELPSSSLIAKKLLDTHVITVAAPDYLAKNMKVAHPSDLLESGHTLIDYRNPETGRTL
jgi:DNA-binding transcriptional LysR family regulator